MKIKKYLITKFYYIIIRDNANHIIPYQNYENHENHKIPNENNENHENFWISFENQTCFKDNRIPTDNYKNMKII